MREEQEFQDWTQDQDDRLRASLGALRQDVDTAGIPDVRFVLKRAGRQRHRAVAGVAAGAAAVLGLSWVGYQSMDNGPSTAPAGTGTVTTERDQSELPTGAPSAEAVDPDDLVVAESGGPDANLFVPPTLWSSDAFTGGAGTEPGAGEFESTGLFDCDPDNVMWGSPEEGTFGILGVWSGGSAFGSQRVRVLDSPTAAEDYVNDLNEALGSCEAPVEADNIVLDVEPLELSGAYRVTTEFLDGTEPMTDFVYVVQHEGSPETVSTFRLTDWSQQATDAEAVTELERLAALVSEH